MTLGEKIKTLRLEKQMSQNELSKKIHVSAAAICKWEQDIFSPKMPHLKSLSEFFGISVEELWNDSIDI